MGNQQSQFTTFSKVKQFRDVIQAIKHKAQFTGLDAEDNPLYDESMQLPIVTFHGTVKLHGTNSSVAVNPDGDIWFQSRKGVVTPHKDNSGFAVFAESHKEIFIRFINDIRDKLELYEKTIVLFGEWCGGNIQKDVAINGLEKMFVLFAVKVVEANLAEEGEVAVNYYLPSDKWSEYSDPENHLHNINDFKSYFIDIDFDKVRDASNALELITSEVSRECPVGKALGRVLDKDCTTGEGVVWIGWFNGDRYSFKVKGEAHKTSRGKKALAPAEIEKMNSITEFVEYSVTENRLNQGVEQVFTTESRIPEITAMGEFIRWVVTDIIDEELDVMVENKLEPKDVKRKISEVARTWYKRYLDDLIF